MQAAIEAAVQQHGWRLETLIPTERPKPPYTHQHRNQVLENLHDFCELWESQFVRLLDPHPQHARQFDPHAPRAMAEEAMEQVGRAMQEAEGHADARVLRGVDQVIEGLWSGRTLRFGMRFSALLADSTERDSHGHLLRLDCCK